MNDEIWRDIEGYDGEYQVSNFGRVKSRKKIKGVTRELIMSLITTSGWVTITLYKKGVGIPFQIHRLVAKTFVPNPHNRKQVRHIDGDKTNNRADNLKWIKPKKPIDYKGVKKNGNSYMDSEWVSPPRHSVKR